MKAKDLKSVFNWENRRVMIHDRIWYVPAYHEEKEFKFPGWESPALFGNNRPIFIEYCSGNGAWILEKAKEHPEKNFIAVEMLYDRVRKIWAKMKNHALANLVIVCGEGSLWTEKYVPERSISGAFVNFPDPWPKARHAKHRIIKPSFASQMSRILLPDADMTLVTDDADYSQIMIDVFKQSSDFNSRYPAPFYTHELEGYGTSYFEQLWKSQGKPIYYHQFTKT